MKYSLRHLLADPAGQLAGDSLIALNPGAQHEQLKGAHLCQRIGAWQAALSSSQNAQIALYLRDSFEFAAALIAIWRLGRVALLPANNLAATCTQLQAHTQTFAGDFPRQDAIQANTQAIPLAAITLPSADAPALVLFTSGSSGEPEPVAKQFSQLETELAALEQQWGASLGAATIVASVSHQHIYGLLFRLLWPVCAGRTFISRERDYWEALAQDAARYQPLALVSSPAHLSRIPPLAWPQGREFSAIFSSGAPLAKGDALALAEYFACPATEVFGSTETGGIAWRQQTQSPDWQCLPGVNVRLSDESLLQVQSGHLANGDWFTSADRAQLSAGGFSLLGRADRIAKVGGKRISLSAIERDLEAHPWVQQAKIIQLAERGERLGGVLVLTNEGNAQLVDQGKNALKQLFSQLLSETQDRVAIPRYWRYLGELPRNAQGKTTQADLLALFAQEDMPRLPELIDQQQDGQTLQLQLYIPSNLYYFDGHFPGRPVLPGVVQTHWAVHYARAQWGELGQFAALEAVKFQQIVGPNQHLRLALEYQPEKDKLYFSYTSGDVEAPRHHASGRVAFIRVASNEEAPND